MIRKIRTHQELQRIKSAWKMTADGVLVWIGGCRIGLSVGIQTLKNGSQNCYLSIDGKLVGYSVGQVAWFLYHDSWPLQEVDHKDCDPKNHKLGNLRLATRAEQCMNRIAGRKGRVNKGVYKRDYGDRWSAQIWVNGVCKNLGTFGSEVEAMAIRHAATKLLHSSFANIKSYGIGVTA